MAEIPLPPDLPSVLADYERRLRMLETAPRLENSAFPWYSSFIETDEATTSTTNTDLATVGPEVTMTVTQTSRVRITMAAGMTVTANTQAACVLRVDGAFPDTPPFSFAPLFLRNDTANRIAATVSATRTWESSIWLTPGEHTFRMMYRVAVGPGTMWCFNRYLQIEPF